MYPSSVVHTGVKSFGCENRTAHESPIQSWKLILPSVVSASKSGAVSPICSAISLSFRLRPRQSFQMAPGPQGRTVSDGGLTQAYPRASGDSELAPERVLFATDRQIAVVHPLDLRQIVCGRSVAEVLEQRLVLRQQLEQLSPLLLLAGRN